MPFNAAPVPPTMEPTGTTALPFARVKRLINIDQEINTCSNQASFVITQATEMFIQYLAEQGHNMVKSEKKPRRNIQYRDLAGAVSRRDNLEFLSDIVPKTMPYAEVKKKNAAKEKEVKGAATKGALAAPANGREAGQTTLDGARNTAVLSGETKNGEANGTGSDVAALGDDKEEDPNAQLNHEMQARGGKVSANRLANGDEEADEEMS
ncbi:hypothetical protein BJ878DRAFT_534203 [Calycina marina]|uniref:Transcription factor CBF/NF-Y/archaeal histone domain-containing protein n=1 Tax=Calycina marina TaxID=1763456 RepID=A0A9P7Z4Z6_9HELO|nr:hypothetical protein BJ878DRAFT_534203 [Calycina marina]